MPPKKAQTAAESQADTAAQDATAATGIESWELPKTLVTKIAKTAVGDAGASSSTDAGGSVPTKFTKDATLSLIKGSTVFINYVAATAHDIALYRSHKTISAADVIKALEQLEFGDIAALMPAELEAYRAHEKAKKAGGGSSKKGKEKAQAPEASGSGAGKITLTIPGGQKKTQAPDVGTSQAGAASSTVGAGAESRGDQADSMMVEEDGGGDDDDGAELEDEGEGDDGGEEGDENEMDVDEGEAGA